MTYTEEVINFACGDNTLMGIIAKPELHAETGVLVLVGGPQYRVGSHRQFVLLSRRLAMSGFAVMRFDYRGMGDSAGQPEGFTAVSADVGAAIEAMKKCLPFIKQVVLWGLCDGASVALLYCHETHDPRVSALCLLNPWVRSPASLARTQVKHYYTKRLMEKEFWIKLLNGGVAVTALPAFWATLRHSLTGQKAINPNPLHDTTGSGDSYQKRMASAWKNFEGRILLLLSGDDYTAKEFLEYIDKDSAWRDAFTHPHLARHDLPGADHTFSSAANRAKVEDLTLALVRSIRLS